MKIDSLGATALFSNSDVDLEDVHLNEEILNQGSEVIKSTIDDSMTRSEPDLKVPSKFPPEMETDQSEIVVHRSTRNHKRSESEPSIQIETNIQVI